MGLNLGYIQVEAVPADGVGAITCRIYYDPNAASPQPLINGPRGYCLDVTNTTGRTCKVEVTSPLQGELVLNVGQGDPVTNRCRTVTQMKNLGYDTREDCAGFSVSIT